VAAALLVLLIVLLPTVAAAQVGTPPPTVPPPTIYVPPTLYPNVIQPGTPQLPPGGVIEITPRTPPPSTIPSGPEIFLPVPTTTPGAARPTKAFDFRPSVGLVEEYSDNFNQTDKGKKSNLRSGVTPAFTVIFEDGPFSGTGGYDLLAFHDTISEDFGVHHNLAGRFAWLVTPLFRLSVTEAFSVSDEPTRADRLSLRQGRQEFTSNTTGFNADYLGAILQAGAYYRLSLFDSQDENTVAHTFGGTVSRSLGAIHALSFGYEYLNTETQTRATSTTTATTIGTPTSSARTTTTTTGHQFTGTFSRDLRVDLSAGITGTYALRNQEQTSARDTDFQRWNVSLFSNYIVPETIVLVSNIGVAALTGGGSDGKPLVTSLSSLTYWLGPAIFSGSFERGFSETFGTAGASAGVVETLGLSASLSYRFTPLLIGTVGGSYRENKTTGVGFGQSGSGQTDETVVTTSAGLSYQLFRWLLSRLEYAHTQLDSHTSGVATASRSYTENRVQLSVTALFYSY